MLIVHKINNNLSTLAQEIKRKNLISFMPLILIQKIKNGDKMSHQKIDKIFANNVLFSMD